MKLTERKPDGAAGLQFEISPDEIKTVHTHNGVTYIKPFLGEETAVMEDASIIMSAMMMWGFNHE